MLCQHRTAQHSFELDNKFTSAFEGWIWQPQAAGRKRCSASSCRTTTRGTILGGTTSTRGFYCPTSYVGGACHRAYRMLAKASLTRQPGSFYMHCLNALSAVVCNFALCTRSYVVSTTKCYSWHGESRNANKRNGHMWTLSCWDLQFLWSWGLWCLRHNERRANYVLPMADAGVAS